EAAPGAFLIGNLGAAQLVAQASGDAIDAGGIRAAVEMIGADALAIHLNFLEEVVQTEGDRRASGIRAALRQAIAAWPVPAIATGGVRTGVDAAKALALGASAAGVARPLLAAAQKGEAAIDDWIEQFREELRAAVFLAGARRAADLLRLPRVITGETRRWLDD